MIDQKKTSSPATAGSISEAERMAKIRELLVGPAIADESARVDENVDRLSELVKEQQAMISALQVRIQDLEGAHRREVSKIRARLLGLVETLLAGDEDVHSRLIQHDTLASEMKRYPEGQDT